MIKPIRYESGDAIELLTVADTTITKHDVLDFESGYVQRATSGTTEVRFVALEDKTTAAGAHETILCLRVDGIQFEADTASTATQALVGTKIDLTDHDTLNQGASSTDVFYVEGLRGTDGVYGTFVAKTS